MSDDVTEVFMNIRPEETEITGRWIRDGERIVTDDTSHRIQQLIKEHLKLVAVSKDGWGKLYKDPFDGRYWELSFPHSELHGGGPPSLRNLKLEDVEQLFDFDPELR